MQHPVRTSASWLAGRLLLLLVVVAALIAWDAYRAESAFLAARLQGAIPDADLVQRLRDGRQTLVEFEKTSRSEVDERLATLRTAEALQRQIDALPAQIREMEARRRTSIQRTVALMTGDDFVDDLKLDLEIQLATAELEILKQTKGEWDAQLTARRNARAAFRDATAETLRAWDVYRARRSAVLLYEQRHPVAIRVPGSAERRFHRALVAEVNSSKRRYDAAGRRFYRAREALKAANAMDRAKATAVRAAGESILGPLDELIDSKQRALDSAQAEAEKIRGSIKRVFWKGLWITIALTLSPVLIKAFWYWIAAPLAARARPIRLRDRPRNENPDVSGGIGRDAGHRRKVSNVSQDIVLNPGEELLVHPEFLQSSADVAGKDTKWILSWRFFFTSLAARMVGLTRIRSRRRDPFVISSTNDPFAEVGVISLAEGAALVLQPRHLVGLVQPVDRPVRITRQWNWSLHAWITLQFRYLIFEGPCRLIVQGCRGVRLEPADSGRSIDQRSTMGFSAHLTYAARRSETFGAYLMGTRGLFNDNFTGGPGFYLYEEMPGRGLRAGITGRGLEGLTDGLMKVVGI